ncbi:phosphatase 2C-like domain-containing protein [Russula earlei]|uniref:Phosphatase 2C-like domain-containing protein n=1 Tax=Russula earlei TaxID=71964 RepID=A0ACC0TRH7_9AGAM|nr:phosphatase 2C-like domain-containing protein [Russula earlei]
MTAPCPTITSFHKRLYTVLPRGIGASRVRSNSVGTTSRTLHSYSPSLLPYFDPSTPPPSYRPSNTQLLSITRLPIEARIELEGSNHPQHAHNGATPPSSLALTPPHSSKSPSSFNGIPLSHLHAPPFFLYQPFMPPSCLPSAVLDPCSLPSTVSSKHRFHFDVGTYGIPKRPSPSVDACRDGAFDAEFWPHRLKLADGLDLAVQVGEDAYFVRDNAMGVADGVGGWSRTHLPKGALSPSALFARRLMHFCSAEVAAQVSSPALPFHNSPPSPKTSLFAYPPSSSPRAVTPQVAGDDCMEDLVDGLDVLLILDRAYERALKSHVIIPSTSATTPFLPASSKLEPLLTGSSTALLAVLDSAGSHVRPPEISVVPDVRAHDAVIRIAHLGDCMGMLVRGDEVIWRSEEMWWAFNTPLQLGPASSTSPSAAQVITLPVLADDILVLASDGLSDNLWDEEVLDEVVRFRRSFLASPVANGSQLPRRTLAGMLSEALCSRARKISQRRFKMTPTEETVPIPSEADDEIPFARRAREEGRLFSGGKPDDISVLVAVISPAEDYAQTSDDGNIRPSFPNL